MPRAFPILVFVAAVLSSTGVTAQRGAAAGQWPAYGGDHGSTKYAPLDQIDRQNVKQLGVIWRWDSPDNPVVSANRTWLPAFPAAFKATPIMVNGVLYIKTSMSQASAIDAATGKALWTFDPEAWRRERPANTGFNSRGVAYWSDGRSGRIFLPTGDAHLWAIDAKTGRPIDSFGSNGSVDALKGIRRSVPRSEYQLMSAPIVVGDVVIVGPVISDAPQYQRAPPGDVRGYDVRTGRELWQFHTIPQQGEFGNQTWEKNSWEYTGAANPWGLLTADPELGYVYIPTGTPTNDYYGGHRPGANLFAESLICLDARTGRRVWHFQFIHHGLWDYDATAAPLLIDLVVDGRPIKAVAVVTKQAFIYVFDRVTGEPVWPIEERPVPKGSVPGEWYSPTQPFPTRPPGFDRQGVTIDDLIDFTPELRKEATETLSKYVYGPIFQAPTVEGDGKLGTILMPGIGGGANWHGAAADPDTGFLYVPSRTSPTVIQLAKPDPTQSDFSYIRGGNRGGLQGPQGLPLFKPPYVRLSAFNLNTGTQAWMIPLGDGPRRRVIAMGVPDPGPLGGGAYTGPLVTKTLLFIGLRGSEAPDLVFGTAAEVAADLEGRRPDASAPRALRVLDKRTGETIHSVELDVSPTGTPMTYMANGKQYIVLAYGTGGSTGLIALALEGSGR
jgi:quinoprotein glucose dehydrogenase